MNSVVKLMPPEFEWDEPTKTFIKSVQEKVKKMVIEPEQLHKRLASHREQIVSLGNLV